MYKCLILICMLGATAPVHAQLWYLTRGVSAQDERAWGVDTGADGKIYWSVEQKDLWPYWYYNIILYKITPDGRQLWQSPSWGGTFNEIAFVTKVSGLSVYLAGREDPTANPNLGNALVLSMNAVDGSYNWHYGYDQGFGYEEIDGISIQSDGIYLTGWTQGEHTDMDFLVQKISLDGSMVWSKSWDYNDFGRMDGANGNLAIDSKYIYAAGHAGRTNLVSFDGDMGLACFSRLNGSLQWSKTWGGLLYDDGLGLTMGADSMLYVVGYTGSFGKGSQTYLNKYSRTGQFQWSRLWGGAGAEDARAVVAGTDSLVYVVGATSSYGHGDYDIFVLKYSPSGNLLDSLIWGGVHKETAHDAALSGDFLYITGETWSFGKDAVAGNGKSEGLLVKVNAMTMEGPDSTMTAVPGIILPVETVKVFPNPADSRLMVDFGREGPHRLAIQTMSGTVAIRFDVIMGSSIAIETGGLLPGVYIVTVVSPGEIPFTGKIIID